MHAYVEENFIYGGNILAYFFASNLRFVYVDVVYMLYYMYFFSQTVEIFTHPSLRTKLYISDLYYDTAYCIIT